MSKEETGTYTFPGMVGNVHPSEYDWKGEDQFGGVQADAGYIRYDAGKIYGLAQYAEELELLAKELRDMVKRTLHYVPSMGNGCAACIGLCPPERCAVCQTTIEANIALQSAEEAGL